MRRFSRAENIFSNNRRLLTVVAVGLVCLLVVWSGTTALAQENVDRLFRFSLGLYKQEFFEESAEQLEKLVKFYPEYQKCDAALYLLGESYYRLGLFARAEEVYQRLITGHTGSKLLPEAVYARAWAFFEINRWQEAADCFQQVVKNYSDRQDLAPEAVFRMAQSLVKAGRVEDAIPVLRQLADHDPPGPFAAEAAYTQAEVLYQRGEYEKASVWYGKVLDSFPESSFVDHALYSLAFSRMKLADFKSAQELFARLRDHSADPSMKREASLRQAKAFCNLQQYRKALEILDGLEPGNPFGDEIAFVRALARFRVKEYEAARAGFTELAEQYPDSSFLAESQELAAECLFRQEKFTAALAGFTAVIKSYQGTRWHETAGLHLGLCHFNRGEMKQATAVLEKTHASFPDGPLAGQILFVLGESRYSAGEYTAAAAAFQAVLELDDRTFKPASLHRLGVLARKDGYHEEALDWFERLAVRFPENALVPDGLYRKGESLAELKRYKEAASVFESLAAMPDNPLAPDAVYQEGESYKALKKYPEAIGLYTSLIDSYPESALVPLARKARAWCYYSSGLMDEAVADYQGLAGRSDLTVDQLSEAQYWLGKSLEKNNNFKSARIEYLKIGILYPDSDSAAAAMFKVGECYRKEGNRKKAIQVFNKVITNYPGSDIIPQARGTLKQLEQGLSGHGVFGDNERKLTEED